MSTAPHVDVSSVKGETAPSEQPSPPINRVFLCMDIGGRSVSPQIIDFLPGGCTDSATRSAHASEDASQPAGRGKRRSSSCLPSGSQNTNHSLPTAIHVSEDASQPSARGKRRSSSRLPLGSQNTNHSLPNAIHGVSSSYIDSYVAVMAKYTCRPRLTLKCLSSNY